MTNRIVNNKYKYKTKIFNRINNKYKLVNKI